MGAGGDVPLQPDLMREEAPGFARQDDDPCERPLRTRGVDPNLTEIAHSGQRAGDYRGRYARGPVSSPSAAARRRKYSATPIVMSMNVSDAVFEIIIGRLPSAIP